MNNYAHLRQDTRNTLANRMNYPLANNSEIAWAYKDGRNYIQISIAKQEDVWVAGLNFWVDNIGGGYSPSRKWGDFSSHRDALLYTLASVLDRIDNHAAKKAIKQAMFDSSYTQLTLF